ncbi:MAG: helix-turn-helix transcriptional regulator [Lachnospiraceae bacterium]|nr:helix-turn-helix transcriptional regulator [Lachnospiraceae bacterium]
MKIKEPKINTIESGKRLKIIMESKATKSNDLATAIGVSPPAVRNYINGVNLPSTQHLYLICKYLNINVTDYFVEENDNE